VWYLGVISRIPHAVAERDSDLQSFIPFWLIYTPLLLACSFHTLDFEQILSSVLTQVASFRDISCWYSLQPLDNALHHPCSQCMVYIIWRIPAKGKRTLHAKDIEQSLRWISVNRVRTGCQLDIGRYQRVGATSNYGYRGVGGKRSRWDLGYQGTEEFLAVLTVTHIVSNV
jgi:predicted RNA-binding Zn-ribbon protein involved in translation (DUF1610 family)